MFRRRKHTVISSLLLTILVVGIFAFVPRPAQAIPVEDIPASIWRAMKDIISKSGSQIYLNVARTAINQFAYDAATYLGSGAPGQKPFFEEYPLGDRLLKAGDAAFGKFIEDVSLGKGVIRRDKDGKPLDKKDERGLDMCSPDTSLLLKITLGLAATRDEYETTNCSFSAMQRTWQSEYDQIAAITQDRNYLNKLSSVFEPGGSDASYTLMLFGKAVELEQEAKQKEEAKSKPEDFTRTEELIGGRRIDPPELKKAQLAQLQALQVQNFGQTTGSIFVDAANIFLNQFALTAFNKIMNNLLNPTSNTGGSSGVADPYVQSNVGGVTQIQSRVSKLLQAQFSDKTDYDILGQLTACPDENKPGPTNCVITQQFSQAITNQITVAQAIRDELLDGNKRIGFNEQGNEFSYRDGYPYRSLIILRKYRVIPVGWEVAAQYIKEHSQTTKRVTLNNLLECFSPDDETYPGYGEKTDEAWCHGLVDPNWVLKIPKLYCGMQGYGPEIMNATITPSELGYCAASENPSCSSQLRSDDCATNFQSCTGNGECSGNTLYKFCNFSIGHEATITRNQDYCADEQSCIKEDPNGSCATYGHCTEEQRKWTFTQQGDNSCEARNNTCQTFRSDAGQVASYLQNTLDYSHCGANEVGCRQYVLNGIYNKETFKVAWNLANGSRYLNKNAPDCDPSREGCHQFIRIKDDLDTNLIADGSFEDSRCIGNANQQETLLPKNNSLIKTALAQVSQGSCELATFNSSGYLPTPNNRWYIRVNSGTVNAGVANDRSSHGKQSLYIEGAGGLYSNDSSAPTILPTGFSFESDRFYTLTATVYVTAGKARAGFGAGTNGQLAESTAIDAWQTLVISYYRPNNGATDFYVEGTDATAKFYIDSVKLTIGGAQTSYSSYLSNNVIYEKLLPKYLESTCYENTGTRGDGPITANYQYKTDAPDECYNFARKCNATEVGCEQYTSLNYNISLTAKTKPKDFCPSVCIGYDVFVQQRTNFSASQSAYFIPETARTCSAQATGCTAFTNLDKLEQGGEAMEYYSYLRNCIKPDTAQCGDFYTWEGSDESGYQLRVFSLKKNGTEPASTLSAEEENLLCNADIFKKLPYEAGYNYDCREFYDQNGNTSYHLYTRTITCSEDCHPYRREVATALECTAGGGTWDTTQGGRCLYYAISNQGTTCSAEEVGCREYTGNIANNIRTVLNDTFEDSQNPTQDWSGGSQSNTSLNLGGHSLFGTNLSKIVGETVLRDRSYTISFLAKAQTSASVSNVDLINKDNQAAAFAISSTSVSTEWKLYTFNLDKLNHEVTPAEDGNLRGPGGPIGEKLRINFSAPVYIDNIKLTEIPNRYYLIKDSWQTPDECDQDIVGNYAPRYMLGCSQYKKTDNSTVNLHSFSSLCQDSAAGCEQMIDTQNSSDYNKKLYNDTNDNGTCDTGENSCVEIPADNIINVAYDRSKECGSSEKGCSRFGLVTTYDQATTYSDIYKKNDPDQYNTVLCSAESVGCSQWTNNNNSIAYFKDPGDEICEWRLKNQSETKYDWYKKKISRCDGTPTGALCLVNEDCANNQTCQLVNVDVLCPSTYDKTIGRGGAEGRVTQPAEWAGTCEVAQAGCTEYIDPTSKFNENLIINPEYRNFDNDPKIEYWTPGTPPHTSPQTQTIGLNPQTVYILKGAMNNNGSTEVFVTCSTADLRVLNTNNNFVSNNHSTKNEAGQGTIGYDNSVMFYLQSDSTQSITCTVTRSHGITNESIYLRRAIVEYQLTQNLDRTSHNGLVNFDKGAILFNERSQEGSKKQALYYNADVTFDTGVDGKPPSIKTPHNANVILKVKPDRSCSKWLSCLTYLPDPNNPGKKTCLDIGLCDKLGPNGTCANFISNIPRKNQTAPLSIANLTGYSKVGYTEGNQSLTLGDYYNIAAMTQVGESIDIVNGNFEKSGGWDIPGNAQILSQPSQISAKKLNPFQVVKNQTNSSFLAPEGSGLLYLPIGSSTVTNDSITMTVGRRYTLIFYSYSQGDGLKIRFEDQTVNNNSFDLVTMGLDEPRNQWVKHSLGFKPSSSLYKIIISKPTSTTLTGDAFIDDLRIEAGLNNRCSDPTDTGQGSSCTDPYPTPPTNPKPQYIGSSCRLYAKDSSLACDYTDNQGIQYKGIRGYCLEADPKDPSACLLWYPVSRIISDTAEEGNQVNFDNKSVYYCIDASDKCDGLTPRFYCNRFLKVDTSLYWNTRLSDNSTFAMPSRLCRNPQSPELSSYSSCFVQTDCPTWPEVCTTVFSEDPYFFTPSADRKIDFGGQGGPVVDIPSIKKVFGSDFFSSLWTDNPLANSQKYITLSGGNINSFIPYYGVSNQQRCASNSGPWNFYSQYGKIVTNLPNLSPWFMGGVSSTSGSLPGTWDVCEVTKAIRLDFQNDCWANCALNNIQSWQYSSNVFRITDCVVNGGGDCVADDVTCSTSSSNRTWTVTMTDNENYGNDDGACVTYCYNRTADYKITNSREHAIDLVRRLFPGNGGYAVNWDLYTWNGGSYGVPAPYTQPPSKLLKACPNNGVGPRPAISDSYADYCYIYPQVSDILVDGLNEDIQIDGAGDVALSFNTKTDPEQLPIKSIVIDWGYKDDQGNPETTTLGPKLVDINPRSITHYFDYFIIKSAGTNGPPICDLNNTQCKVKPKIKIIDNWGYSKEVPFSHNIIVKNPAN